MALVVLICALKYFPNILWFLFDCIPETLTERIPSPIPNISGRFCTSFGTYLKYYSLLVCFQSCVINALHSFRQCGFFFTYSCNHSYPSCHFTRKFSNWIIQVSIIPLRLTERLISIQQWKLYKDIHSHLFHPNLTINPRGCPRLITIMMHSRSSIIIVYLGPDEQ